MNPAEFLTISSAVVPDRDALVSGDGRTRISYAEMASRVNRLSNALQSMGTGIGDRVAVMATNSTAYVEVYYACARLGACFVPINFRAKQDELSFMLNTSDAVLLFAEERYLDLIASLRSEVPGLRDVITLDRAAAGLRSFDDLIDGASEDEVFVEVDEDEPTVLIYTSGTTAMPKGVELTYLNLSLYVVNTMSPADPSAEHEKTLLSVTIAHVAGITAILSSIWGGRTLVILPQFDPELWLEAVERESATHAFVVPTMLKRLMDYPHFAKHDISSLKLITYGAAPMPYEVVCRAIEVFTCDLMNAYGQTESTSSLTYLGPEDHRLNGSDAENARKLHRLRSVGRAMDDVEVAILDAEREPLTQGEEGEICVRSARVMKEYIKADEATAEAIVDGWLHTGDIGYLDEDGYLFITGRVKDLINRGGEKITAADVEMVLDEHELVEESAVIAAPDPEWGETVKAVVVLNPEGRKRDAGVVREDLREHCRTHLASYKTPAYIAFIDELPRNPMGKVLKTDLRRDHGAPDDE